MKYSTYRQRPNYRFEISLHSWYDINIGLCKGWIRRPIEQVAACKL